MHSLSEQIVASARSYIGTRFAHQGRRKASGSDRGGIDCLGLLVGVAAECRLMRGGQLLCEADARDYGHIPDSQRLRQALNNHLISISQFKLRSADILLLSIDNNPQHLGIVGEYNAELTLIHAYAPARRVVEHRLDEDWRARVVAAYRFGEDGGVVE